jgi:4-hydroxy-tetrahydrodipicolinate synthase
MGKPELVVAPPTPFTGDLKVDEAALKREIDYMIEDCGATKVVAAGVEAQEYTCLGLEERKALIRRTVEYLAGRCPVDEDRHAPDWNSCGGPLPAVRFA